MLPHLDTARLLLRPRSLDHVEACIAMDRDPDHCLAGHYAVCRPSMLRSASKRQAKLHR